MFDCLHIVVQLLGVNISLHDASDDISVTTNGKLNNNNDLNIGDVLLMMDDNNQIAIECLVFGNYNNLYKSLQFQKKKEKSEENLIALLHKMQYQTIDHKLKNIAW